MSTILILSIYFVCISLSFICKVSYCGLYEEKVDVNVINFQKETFEAILTDLKLPNDDPEEICKTIEEYKIDLISSRIFGICNFVSLSKLFEMYRTKDLSRSFYVLSSYDLIENEINSETRYHNIKFVEPLYCNEYLLKLQSKTVGAEYTSVDAVVHERSLKYMDNLLSMGEQWPRFEYIKTLFESEYSSTFQYCISMIRQSISDPTFQHIKASEGITKLKEYFIKDIGKESFSDINRFEKLKFAFLLFQIGNIIDEIVKSKEFPFMNLMELNNIENGIIRIHNSVCFEIMNVDPLLIDNSIPLIDDFTFTLYTRQWKKINIYNLLFAKFKNKISIPIKELCRANAGHVLITSNNASIGQKIIQLSLDLKDRINPFKLKN